VNDILRWAKEADLWMTSDERIAAVERFAALVRDDEREQCAIAGGAAAMAGMNHLQVADAIRTRGQA
jgi:hypothetical protein